MAFGLKLRGCPKAEIDAARRREPRSILGLEDLLQRKPQQLSGGQRQRVALGRAIVREPQVFLMDEPLSNLDAKLRVQMRAEISKLHQRDLGTTTIYVTHDQVEAMTHGRPDRGHARRHHAAARHAAGLYDAPANIFVAGFIGSPAMNLFEATVDEQQGDLYVASPATASACTTRR